jgi:FixJ family two-component response regulator
MRRVRVQKCMPPGLLASCCWAAVIVRTRPADAKLITSPDSPGRRGPAGRNDHMTLAIVEDDEEVRRALARLLQCLGHEVRAFASAEAFEADAVTADCLIVDVRLPGMSGIELRERVRARAVPTPVVLITGDAGSRPRDGATDFEEPSITKPFDDATLIAAIADAVATHVRLGSRCGG